MQSNLRTATRPGRSRSRGSLVAAGLLLCATLTWGFASQLGIARLPVMAGLVGPRNAVTLVLAAAGIATLVAAILLPRARFALVPLTVAVLIGADASAPIMFERGFGNDAPRPASASTLRVLSWNINGDLVSPTTIARLAAEEHADVVVLPEITASTTGHQYTAAFAHAGLDVRAYPAIADDPVETVVLVRVGLGTYSGTVGHSQVRDKSAALTPLSPTLPRILAIHAAQPALRDNTQWQADLHWIEEQCRNPDTVAVGDFNATLDSFGTGHLGGCTDAAETRHAASSGTWPTRIPTWVGMPLDHVLTGRDWLVRSFTIVTSEDASGARHRPILAVITRRN